jgi:gamma-glutamyltranspeptidase/glutathione hydrolase
VAVALALEDALRTVRDGADVRHLLSDEHLAKRRADAAGAIREPAGGTVYLCVVDAAGMAVSLVQSLYESFGSGVVAGSTGVVLQNRAACFAVQGNVAPGRRPYHTLIPGMLIRGSELVGPFGVMGGFIQAQAHVQLVSSLTASELDPQAALDRGRFRIDGLTLSLEESLWSREGELARLGYRIEKSTDRRSFGGGQAIICRDGALFGGSDARKDGCALGF